jgi:hypothetical protein
VSATALRSFNEAKSSGSPIAKEALAKVGALPEIEQRVYRCACRASLPAKSPFFFPGLRAS